MKRTAILGFVGVCLLLVAGGSTAASASKTSWRATEAVLPANAATPENQDVLINSVSCASAGNCSAVGNYMDSSGLEEGLLLTEKAHRWATGVEAKVPEDAGPSVDWIASVSCRSAGNCTAVSANGLLWTETAGRWGAGVEPALPANAQSGPFGPIVYLNSVSCASAGNCTVVGEYEDTPGGFEGLLLTETAGRWRTGLEAPLPSNGDATRIVALSSVSCASAGNCSAVGYYNGYWDSGGDGLLLTEQAGKWRTGVEAVMPKNAIAGKPASLTSVSCASAGNCAAVGTYNNDESSKDLTPPRGVLLTEKAGKWRAGVKAVPPANSATGGAYQVGLNSVSCPAAGNCVAVGDYVHGSGNIQGMLLTEKAGKWSRGLEAALPRNADAPELQEEDAYLSSVSCASPGNCTAAGGYTDNSRVDRGLLVTETAGSWARGVEAAQPSNSHLPAGLTAVSCASPAYCSAAGQYGPSGREGLLLDSSAKPCVVPQLKGMALPAAERSMASHDCSVGRIEHGASRRVKRNHVISQQPKPGRRLGVGGKVSLVVSDGP